MAERCSDRVNAAAVHLAAVAAARRALALPLGRPRLQDRRCPLSCCLQCASSRRLLFALTQERRFLKPLLLSLLALSLPPLLSLRVWRPAAPWRLRPVSCSLTGLAALLGGPAPPRTLLFFRLGHLKERAQRRIGSAALSCRLRCRSLLGSKGHEICLSSCSAWWRWRRVPMPVLPALLSPLDRYLLQPHSLFRSSPLSHERGKRIIWLRHVALCLRTCSSSQSRYSCSRCSDAAEGRFPVTVLGLDTS